jgi:hypothetical protein
MEWRSNFETDRSAVDLYAKLDSYADTEPLQYDAEPSPQDTTPVTTEPDDLIFGFEPQTLMIVGAIGIGFFIFMSGK